jgi:XapX domain-containing protein
MLETLAQYGLPLLTGLIVGLIFGFAKLPIPAPIVFEGIVGIVGIWGGYKLVPYILKLLGF